MIFFIFVQINQYFILVIYMSIFILARFKQEKVI